MGGDVAPLMSYLTGEMGDLQAEVRDAHSKSSFGTVIGTVSVEPDLGVPVTVFKYVFSGEATAELVVSVPCGRQRSTTTTTPSPSWTTCTSRPRHPASSQLPHSGYPDGRRLSRPPDIRSLEAVR